MTVRILTLNKNVVIVLGKFRYNIRMNLFGKNYVYLSFDSSSQFHEENFKPRKKLRRD